MIEITPEYLASQGLSKTFPQRFWKKVNKTESCWLWTGQTIDGFGYGMLAKGIPPHQPITAHRAAWILCRGPIPEGKWVLHNCPGKHNPKCCNPEHLKLGDRSDNMQDARAQGTLYAATITTDVARAIKLDFRANGGLVSHLAKRHGVGYGCAWSIIRGRTWRTVE